MLHIFTVNQYDVQPPSATNILPFTNEASSEARKRATLAISSAFEIYKLGTILLNRKSKKNKALYTNIQYITNTHLVNSI